MRLAVVTDIILSYCVIGQDVQEIATNILDADDQLRIRFFRSIINKVWRSSDKTWEPTQFKNFSRI